MEPPTKKLKASYIHSDETKEKNKNHKKKARKFKKMFIVSLR